MSFPVDPLKRQNSAELECGRGSPENVQDSFWLGRSIKKGFNALTSLFRSSPPVDEVTLHIDQMRAAHQQFLQNVSPRLPAHLPVSGRLEIPVQSVDDVFAEGAPVAAVLDRLNGYDHYEWGHVGVKLSREIVERAERANYSPGDQLKIVDRLIEKMDEVEEARFRKHVHIRKGPLLDLKYKLLAANPRLPNADREKASISEAVLNHLKFMVDSLGSGFPGGRALLRDRMAEVYYDVLKNPEADEGLRDTCKVIQESCGVHAPLSIADDLFMGAVSVADVLDRLNRYDHYEWIRLGSQLSYEIPQLAERAGYSPGDRLKIVDRLIEKTNEVQEVRFRKRILLEQGALLDLKYKLLAQNPGLPGADKEKARISESLLSYLKSMINATDPSRPGESAFLRERMAEVYYDMLKNPEADEGLQGRCHRIRGLG